MSAIQQVSIPSPPPPAPDERAGGTWTTARVEQLRRYAGAGYTCLQIAREIGVTRNAVIGKLNRLGLTKPRPARAHDAKGAHAREPRVLTQRRILHAAFAAMPFAADATVASAAPCTLLELTRETCRWPIGDADAKDVRFCGNGAVAGLSYCAGHARIAYRVPARRQA